MFHDDRVWCVRPAGTPEVLAALVTGRRWPACTAFQTGGYLFLNDSLPGDGATDFAVARRPADPGGRFVQVASLTLGFCDNASALRLIRRVLAGTMTPPTRATRWNRSSTRPPGTPPGGARSVPDPSPTPRGFVR